MEIKVINQEEIPFRGNGGRRASREILMSLAGENTDAVEIIDWQSNFKTWRSAYTALRMCADKMGLDIKVLKRGDRIFLVKKDK